MRWWVRGNRPSSAVLAVRGVVALDLVCPIEVRAFQRRRTIAVRSTTRFHLSPHSGQHPRSDVPALMQGMTSFGGKVAKWCTLLRPRLDGPTEGAGSCPRLAYAGRCSCPPRGNQQPEGSRRTAEPGVLIPGRYSVFHRIPRGTRFARSSSAETGIHAISSAGRGPIRASGSVVPGHGEDGEPVLHKYLLNRIEICKLFVLIPWRLTFRMALCGLIDCGPSQDYQTG